jgi:hypothetical protein
MPFKTVPLTPEQKTKNDSFDRKDLELKKARWANRDARHAFLSELFEVPASDFVEADLGQRKYGIFSSDGQSASLVDSMEHESHVLESVSEACGVKQSPYKSIAITKEQGGRYFATLDSRCAGGGKEHVEFVASLAGISPEEYDRKYSTSYTFPEGGTLYLMKRTIADV